MHWKTLIDDQKYIGAYSLTPGEDKTVTIKSVSGEEITGTGGKKQDCRVIRLNNEKPMILNATNSKSIAKLYGSDVENWVGKEITLYASTTQVAGETVECLRIRPVVAAIKAKPISDEKLGKALDAIQAGTFTVEQLMKKFELTEEQQARLPKQIEAPAQ